LKNLKENIERQKTLAMHERNELRALQRSLENEQSDFATAEKLSQSISRL
jgi:hypothetical protein